MLAPRERNAYLLLASAAAIVLGGFTYQQQQQDNADRAQQQIKDGAQLNVIIDGLERVNTIQYHITKGQWLRPADGMAYATRALENTYTQRDTTTDPTTKQSLTTKAALWDADLDVLAALKNKPVWYEPARHHFFDRLDEKLPSSLHKAMEKNTGWQQADETTRIQMARDYYNTAWQRAEKDWTITYRGAPLPPVINHRYEAAMRSQKFLFPSDSSTTPADSGTLGLSGVELDNGISLSPITNPDFGMFRNESPPDDKRPVPQL